MEQVYTTPKPARSVVVPNLKINLEVKRGATSRPVNHYDDRRVGLYWSDNTAVLEPGHGPLGQRFWPGRVGSRVGVTDPLSHPVL